MLEIKRDTIRVMWEDGKLNPNSFASSKDGRLVSVGSYWGGNGVSIWQADTGRLVRELPIGDAHMDFAADGRRLYATTGRLSPRGAECRSWWVGSWEPDRALPLKRTSHSPAHLRVAADGTVAVLFSMNDVRLLDPESLEELATLSAPEPGLLQGVEFSPDGATLLTTASGTVHVWDLRRLHQELAGLGLDWSAAPSACHARISRFLRFATISSTQCVRNCSRTRSWKPCRYAIRPRTRRCRSGASAHSCPAPISVARVRTGMA